ncbi:MAG: reverse transcriptase domain-containing protein [bacterium]
MVIDIFKKITSSENLFSAWVEFRKGKERKTDVLAFAWRLEENIFELQRKLQSGRYRHGHYTSFNICDPKPRNIHKATVRDRIVHHAVFAALNPIFEPTFIADSFSCRVNRGTHKGVERLHSMLRKASRNNTWACYALKCDVRKFFVSVDQNILLTQIRKRITDEKTFNLVERIITSYNAAVRESKTRFARWTANRKPYVAVVRKCVSERVGSVRKTSAEGQTLCPVHG